MIRGQGGLLIRARTKNGARNWAEAASGNAQHFPSTGCVALGRRVRVMARGRYYFPVARVPRLKERFNYFGMSQI